MKSNKKQKNEVKGFAILLAGRAGQGIKTIERIITTVLKREGLYVFATRGYMSRVRGGMNATQIRVGTSPVSAPVEKTDLFVPLAAEAFDHFASRLDSRTCVVADEVVSDGCDRTGFGFCAKVLSLPFTQMAVDAGNRVYANAAAAGAVLALLDVPVSKACEVIEETFVGKGPEVVRKNSEVLTRAYKRAEHLRFHHNLDFVFARQTDPEKHVFFSGTEAVALGALSAGTDFCSSYPMSPSTGVLTFLAQHGKECGVAVEQATDEIGAVNMALGAAYAGARAIVTTSGGGFALMGETVSLAGMTETPLTVHIAQRPGPATGLPTRTAQEDLNLVLRAGHGEFARAVYAPGDASEAFNLTQHALDKADKYQIPTFILTDQFLVDSLTMTEEKRFCFEKVKRHIVKTGARYRRYDLSDAVDGVSPRGVPGYGEGLVCVDSDEHDETGHITEDFAVRRQMVEKRLAKLPALAAEAVLPTWFGLKKAPKVLVVWGSNKAAAQEAWETVNDKTWAVCHFSQVYPFNPKVKRMLKNKKVVVMENNATGQFADLLRSELGIEIAAKKLKYTGEPFTVEEVMRILEGKV